MDRLRQKPKKEKPMKHVDKEKSVFITDVKTIKENLKIKEILRSVKMNSSMRIKAPRGSVVMNNNDFTDVPEDFLDENGVVQHVSIPDDLQEAKNSDLVNQLIRNSEQSNTLLQDEVVSDTEQKNAATQENLDSDLNIEAPDQPPRIQVVNVAAKVHGNQDKLQNDETVSKSKPTKIKGNGECPVVVKNRERKLSLDHTMLTKREGLSQSEIDLHSIGKSPLERKSSFFRKKMDSFLKNTTEIFKRQSLGSKSQTMSRRGSMSVSLQSLNEKGIMDRDEYDRTTHSQQEVRGSAASIASGSTLGHSEQDSVGSEAALSASQPIVVSSDGSPRGVDGVQNSFLNSRAISMSSGLDSTFGQRRRKASRSNRVTWVASEGLTNYLRRLTQDETTREIYAAHSYQDFSSIPENSLHEPKLDSKGRRLSYQRAVSGEDPVLPPRYHDSSLRRKRVIPEHSEADYELANHLAEFSRSGVPPLPGYAISTSTEPRHTYIFWAESQTNVTGVYDWSKLSSNEEARQAVIRELIVTEADYLRHLICLVELFMAAAHSLQDSGRMLEVDSESLFSNIPDLFDASLTLWENAFYPTVREADENGAPYKTNHLASGFKNFRDTMLPYEKYVDGQSRVLDYFRSLSSDSDFMAYLQWCHAQKECNRLQLPDLIIKPMQRLTKYSMILRRISDHTESEAEIAALNYAETRASNFVLGINRSIRQREELERLEQVANSIEIYELEFKDDDMEKYFKLYSYLNLRGPMINSFPFHSRSVIYEGDLRYKDTSKEIEVHVYLLTDMMLICKKLKGSLYPFKLLRPKYMVDRMIFFPRYSQKNPKEISSLIVLMVDSVASSYQCFSLSEATKDPNIPNTMKMWELKLKEAKLTYDIGVWCYRNNITEFDVDTASDSGAGNSSGKGSKQNSEELNIEREARERVAAMLHRRGGTAADHELSQASTLTDSFEIDPYGGRMPTLQSLRFPMQRTSTSGSSRQSRLSSFQQSTSAASHDEPQPGPSRCTYQAGSSVEHVIPPQNPDDAVTSITVNVVSESESETVGPSHQQTPVSHHKLLMRSAAAVGSHNTLRVQPQSGVLALMHSLPDLTIDPAVHVRPTLPPAPQTASEKLYQSHQELLQRNRLLAASHHQHLSPDHRGTSYPPPSPTRAALRRGMAFSDSFKYPPLSKMGHVNSQSQHLQAEPQPSTSSAAPRSEQGAVNPMHVPSTSTEKEKKKHLISSRNKGGSRSESACSRRKDDKAE